MSKHHTDFGPLAIYRSKYLIITFFGLLVGLGFFLAAIHAWFYLGLKFNDLPMYQVRNLGLRLSIAIPLGAYLMARILDLKRLLSGKVNFSTFIRIPGFALWGGLISGLITILISASQYNWETLVILDAVVFGLPLAQMFGRIGCLNYGCCHGRPNNGPWSIKYRNPESKVIRTYSHLKGVALYPTQIFSGLANLTIYLILLAIVVQLPMAESGLLSTVYFILYGLKRFIIEFFRGEFPRTSLLKLSLWQWFSLGFIFSGILLGLNLMNPLFGANSYNFQINSGFIMVKMLMPGTIIATAIISFIYSLHGKKIGVW